MGKRFPGFLTLGVPLDVHARRKSLCVSLFLAVSVNMGSHASENGKGRGASLLSCGDVESNPGPTGGLLGRLIEQHRPPPVHPPVRAPDQQQTDNVDVEMEIGEQVDVQGPANTFIPTFTCPLNCGARPWASKGTLFTHMERHHLGHTPLDTPILLSWLREAKRRVCENCLLLAPVLGPCRRCKNKVLRQPQMTVLQNGNDEIEEPCWEQLFLSQTGVIRAIPSAAMSKWLDVLSSELDRIKTDSPPEHAWRFAAFCRIALQPLGRGGRKHQRQGVATFLRRLATWEAGQHRQLLEEFLDHLAPPSKQNDTLESDDYLDEGIRRAVLRATKDGAFSKASQLLTQKLAPLPEDIFSALQALHPQNPPPTLPLGPCIIGDDFTVEEVAECLSSFRSGSAGGYSGLMADHIKASASPSLARVHWSLARLTSDFAWGRLMPETAALLGGARLVPIGKPDGGVRPIAVGELIRRLAGKLLISRYQPEIAKSLCPVQLGVGVKGGAESIIHKVRSWSIQPPAFHGILQLDFSNAFNCLDRTKMLASIAKHAPIFLPYAISCYSRPANLFAPGFMLDSESGEHQGDPAGPLFFALATKDLAASNLSPDLSWAHWYLDDAHLCGPVSHLHDLLPSLEREAAHLGLKLNRAKCALFSGPDVVDPALLPGVPRIFTTNVLKVLGSPVGSPEDCKRWVQHHVLAPLKNALHRLEGLADPQAASLILRQCLSGCKLMWILRTADPVVSQWTAQQSEPLLREAWCTILGCTVGDANWELSTLPISAGGAGIQNPMDIWDTACVASWLTAATNGPCVIPLAPTTFLALAVSSLVARLQDNRGPLPLVQELISTCTNGNLLAIKHHPSLRKWCDQSSWTTLWNSIRADKFSREAVERLSSLQKLQAVQNGGLWLQALPKTQDWQQFSPQEWQSLLRARIGLPLYPENSSCVACGQCLDPYGDHAQCCAGSGLYRRHNRVRDAVWRLAKVAGWDPILEAHLPNSLVRPGDILLRAKGPRPVAIDVTVVHPMRPSGPPALRNNPHTAAEAAEKLKTAKMQDECNRVGWVFKPFGLEVTGGMAPGAHQLFKQLIRQISMKTGLSPSDVARDVLESISLALAKGRGEMLVFALPSC